MSGGEKHVFFASENPGFPSGLRTQTAPCRLRGRADGACGMRIFGKMKGQGA